MHSLNKTLDLFVKLFACIHHLRRKNADKVCNESQSFHERCAVGDSFVGDFCYICCILECSSTHLTVYKTNIFRSVTMFSAVIFLDISYILLSVICIAFIHQLQCVMHTKCIAVGYRIGGRNKHRGCSCHIDALSLI